MSSRTRGSRDGSDGEDEDDAGDKYYGDDGNKYNYNDDYDDNSSGHGKCNTMEDEVIEILSDSSHGSGSSPNVGTRQKWEDILLMSPMTLSPMNGQPKH